MPWIGVHVQESWHPHCTIAWWELGRAKSRGYIEATKAIEEVLERLRRNNIHELRARTTGQTMFGPRRDIPVDLLEPSGLRLARYALSVFDQRPQPPRLHVVRRDPNPSPPPVYVFTHLSLTWQDKQIKYWRIKP